MNQYMAETSIINGHLELNNIPFADNMNVKVIVIPKADLSQMTFPRIREKSRAIKGSLANDVSRERDER